MNIHLQCAEKVATQMNGWRVGARVPLAAPCRSYVFILLSKCVPRSSADHITTKLSLFNPIRLSSAVYYVHGEKWPQWWWLVAGADGGEEPLAVAGWNHIGIECKAVQRTDFSQHNIKAKAAGIASKCFAATFDALKCFECDKRRWWVGGRGSRGPFHSLPLRWMFAPQRLAARLWFGSFLRIL